MGVGQVMWFPLFFLSCNSAISPSIIVACHFVYCYAYNLRLLTRIGKDWSSSWALSERYCLMYFIDAIPLFIIISSGAISSIARHWSHLG